MTRLQLIGTATLILVILWVIHGAATNKQPSANNSEHPSMPIATDAMVTEVKAKVTQMLAGTEREVARITLEPIGTDDVLASKVGGVPYLEIGQTLPTGPSGEDMVLLAQINFAEVPAMTGYPRHGILQFFIDSTLDGDYGYGVEYAALKTLSTEQNGYRIRYIEYPSDDSTRWQQVDVPESTGQTPHEPDRPLRMRFEHDVEPINPWDGAIEKRIGIDPSTWMEAQANQYGVDVDDLSERAWPADSSHKIGGYPFFTQYDPRPADSSLRLLFQLNSDDTIMWGDAGVGNFFIDPEDLQRRDFSRVLYSWDCY